VFIAVSPTKTKDERRLAADVSRRNLAGVRVGGGFDLAANAAWTVTA